MGLITVDAQQDTVAEASRKYMRGEISADELRAIERESSGSYHQAMLSIARTRRRSRPGLAGWLARWLEW